MTTTAIDTNTTVGDLVVANPSRARLFEALRIDYCCGGRRSLLDECARRGLAVDEVVEAIGAYDQRAPDHDDRCQRVARLSIDELCDHIVEAHHEPERRELERIAELFTTVVRVHGRERPDIREAGRIFDRMRTDLARHIDVEEQTLFPACREASISGAAVDERLLSAHEHDHSGTGAALARLRALSGGGDAGRLMCRTHGVLLGALRELEREIHRHVHEENNLLFVRVRRQPVA